MARYGAAPVRLAPLLLWLPSRGQINVSHGGNPNRANDTRTHFAGDGNVTAMNCIHGTWAAEEKVCKCDTGWGTAGITDTVDFVEGVCEQYHCVSDEVCQERLKIPSSTCPIKGWNCYCGWEWAVKNKWHGWETPTSDEGGAECMGVMYTFSFTAARELRSVLEWVWTPFAILALLSLPFGRKRVRCDHHQPSLSNFIRKCLGLMSECNGDCTTSTSYTWDILCDDLAWSVYWMELGVWVYFFICGLIVVAVELCSIVLWLVILAIVVAGMCVGLIGLCMSGCEAGSASCDGGFASCGLPECAGGECCIMGDPGAALAGGAGAEMYWAGPFPVDYWYSPYFGGCGTCSGGSGDCDGCSCGNACCRLICKPIAALCYIFPVLPENALGGLCGYLLLGTHPLTEARNAYQGGSQFIDQWFRMSWRQPRSDLHSDSAWREQVRVFLQPQDAVSAAPRNQRMMGHSEPLGFREGEVEELVPLTGSHRNEGATAFLRIGNRGCTAFILPQQFTIEEHRCVESSFGDYKAKLCWICQDPASSEGQWDMWMQCRHLFCKRCSTEMLNRNMPCPLCRVTSSRVLRGFPYDDNQIPDRDGSSGL